MCPCALRSRQERPSHLPNPKCPTLYKETVGGRKSRASDPEPADDGDGGRRGGDGSSFPRKEGGAREQERGAEEPWRSLMLLRPKFTLN